jgi:hypothetical protein
MPHGTTVLLYARYKPWAQGLIRLLVAKGVVTYDAIQRGAEAQDSTLGKGSRCSNVVGPMPPHPPW